jgi:hypothetical protein
VVGNRKELTYLLSQAAELGHGPKCEYLYAPFSLKTSAWPGLRDDQLAAVERWRCRRRGRVAAALRRAAATMAARVETT